MLSKVADLTKSRVWDAYIKVLMLAISSEKLFSKMSYSERELNNLFGSESTKASFPAPWMVARTVL